MHNAHTLKIYGIMVFSSFVCSKCLKSTTNMYFYFIFVNFKKSKSFILCMQQIHIEKLGIIFNKCNDIFFYSLIKVYNESHTNHYVPSLKFQISFQRS